MGEDVEGRERGIIKETKRLWGVGYVHYLDCGAGFMGVFMSKLIKLFTLNMCSLLYVNYAMYNAVKKIFFGSTPGLLNLKLWQWGPATHF